jgi:general secretion pathway protein G
MNQHLVNRTDNEKGMTLIEIMIVLAIIGSVMAVLLPNIQRNMQTSKVKETKLAMNNVINALNLYSTDCGKYPKSLDGLMNAPADCTNWGPEAYMKKAPQDSWKHDFVYEAEGNSFTLKSLGADGREGGDKYDKDITQDDLN